MGLQALTTSINPVLLADVKAHLRIGDTNDDVTLAAFLGAAFEYVETETRQQLCTRQYLLTYDGFPGERCFPFWHDQADNGVAAYPDRRGREWRTIKLPKPPLQSVQSLAYTDAGGNPQTLDPATYTVDPTAMPGRIVLKPGQSWPQTEGSANCVRITYTAGYSADAANVPTILRQGILLLVGHYYENREGAIDRRIDCIPLGVESILNQNMYPTAQG